MRRAEIENGFPKLAIKMKEMTKIFLFYFYFFVFLVFQNEATLMKADQEFLHLCDCLEDDDVESIFPSWNVQSYGVLAISDFKFDGSVSTCDFLKKNKNLKELNYLSCETDFNMV